MRVAEITTSIIERATDLRARYGGRTPDAIHLATAIDKHADQFLTGDAVSARCTEVPVKVLRPREPASRTGKTVDLGVDAMNIVDRGGGSAVRGIMSREIGHELAGLYHS
jgi:PIN domain-containing protein